MKKEFSDEYTIFKEIFGEVDISEVVVSDYEYDGIYGLYNPNSWAITIFGAGGKEGKGWIAKTAQSMKKKGKWSTGSPFHSLRHELGHALQSRLKRTDSKYSEKLEQISAVRKEIFDSLTNLDESDIIEVKKRKLSIYGLDENSEIDEFISECIAEYCNGNPRATAKKVVDILLS